MEEERITGNGNVWQKVIEFTLLSYEEHLEENVVMEEGNKLTISEGTWDDSIRKRESGNYSFTKYRENFSGLWSRGVIYFLKMLFL